MDLLLELLAPRASGDREGGQRELDQRQEGRRKGAQGFYSARASQNEVSSTNSQRIELSPQMVAVFFILALNRSFGKLRIMGTGQGKSLTKF